MPRVDSLNPENPQNKSLKNKNKKSKQTKIYVVSTAWAMTWQNFGSAKRLGSKLVYVIKEPLWPSSCWLDRYFSCDNEFIVNLLWSFIIHIIYKLLKKVDTLSQWHSGTQKICWNMFIFRIWRKKITVTIFFTNYFFHGENFPTDFFFKHNFFLRPF